MTKLTMKIKDEYGSVKRFCEKNNINLNTYKVVISGNGTSSKIANILINHRYITSADDLKKAA
ncbi:hypothetical protein [Sulfurimonas sp.]|uniref:hypothetical protein n=1 Tax=Sulfurimonas sp. TaxID=2022749 RepID=UPI0025FE35D7|nr:hypothetical protein [Sulfurimonas sp.]